MTHVDFIWKPYALHLHDTCRICVWVKSYKNHTYDTCMTLVWLKSYKCHTYDTCMTLVWLFHKKLFYYIFLCFLSNLYWYVFFSVDFFYKIIFYTQVHVCCHFHKKNTKTIHVFVHFLYLIEIESVILEINDNLP